jgi:hypothetical protein
MSPGQLRALAVGGLLLAALAALHGIGVGLVLLFGLGVVVAVVALLMPALGVRGLDAVLDKLREWRWRAEEGRHHAFEGVSIEVRDDGRHAWIAGADLRRLLRTRDGDDVLAARHAGRWQRDDRGRLWLRDDAVVEHLATMPGRAEPRNVRLRRYIEREVIYPLARRRERGR